MVLFRFLISKTTTAFVVWVLIVLITVQQQNHVSFGIEDSIPSKAKSDNNIDSFAAKDEASLPYNGVVTKENKDYTMSKKIAQDHKVEKEAVCTEGDNTNPSNWNEFRKFFKRLGTSWSHVFRVYRDTVQNAHGKHMSGDLLATTMEEALEQLRALVQEQQISHYQDHDDLSGSNPWNLQSVPLEEFDKTVDDLYIAFLRWSASDSSIHDDDDCVDKLKGGKNKKNVIAINISNAFRRLESYVLWMDEQSADIIEPPLSWASVKYANDLLYSKVTVDNCDRVVWWLDLGQTNFIALQKLPHKEILRLFVWLAHLVMFDNNAQMNGIVFVDNMATVTFYQYMTMLPLHLGMVIDKFMISVIPLKTKLVVFREQPFWFDIAFGMLRMFLRKEMQQRVVIDDAISDNKKENLHKGMPILQGIVGIDQIPIGFDDLEGNDLVADLIIQHEKRQAQDI